MELHYIYVQNNYPPTYPPRRRVLCERVAATADGFWLYRYMRRHNIYIDDEYAEDLEELKYIIRWRHGWYEDVFLIKEFEKVVDLFALRAYPRVIYLTSSESFCTHITDELFDAELCNSGEIGRVNKWIDDVEKPKILREALEKLNEYAQKANAWVIFKRRENYVVAHLAYPSP